MGFRPTCIPSETLMRLRLIAAALLISTANPAAAANPAPAPIVQDAPFDAAHWTLSGKDLAFIEDEGAQVLRMREGLATLKAPEFSTGTVSFDVLFSGVSNIGALFSGLRFHTQGVGDYEFLYLRPHRSGEPDATQYTPVFHGDSGWQIYSGPEFATPEVYKLGGWNHVEIRIYPDSADVYINGARSLRIADLKSGHMSGGLALEASIGARRHYGQILYKNLRYSSEPLSRPADMPAPVRFEPAGLVRSWTVSEALTDADALDRAGRSAWAGVTWTPLAVETNGIANLARVTGRTKTNRTTIARFEVTADKVGSRLMRFGYSDISHIFVNGRPVFEGDASFFVRDPQFQGIVGFHDAVSIPLNRGRNDVVFVVKEDFGGWAAAAQFAEPAGLSGPALAATR
jgi:hypothetical protein